MKAHRIACYSALMVFLAAQLHAAQEVGTVLALQGKATATGEDKAVRQLAVKATIYLKDKVETLEGSKVQIQFKDETVISQGEKSSIVIDEYVYDPDKADEVNSSLKCIQGVFRVITGKITKMNPDRFKVKTRMATIGIRGCELGFKITKESDNVYVINLAGKETVRITTHAENLMDNMADNKWGDEQTQKKLVNFLNAQDKEVKEGGKIVSISIADGMTERDLTPGELAQLIEAVTPIEGGNLDIAEGGGEPGAEEAVEEPADDDAAPGDETAEEPADDGAAPADETAEEPADDGVAPGEEVAEEPADDGAVPVDETAEAPVDDGALPVDEMAELPADEGALPVDETAALPADDGMVPADSGILPADDTATLPADSSLPLDTPTDSFTADVPTDSFFSDTMTDPAMLDTTLDTAILTPPPPTAEDSLNTDPIDSTPPPDDTTPSDSTTPSEPPPEPPPDTGGGGGGSVFISKGGGTDWDWGVWELDGVPDSVDFSSSSVISPVDFQAIAVGTTLYQLTGSGDAAAIIRYGGAAKLVEGVNGCSVFVEVGQSRSPSWNGSFNMSNSDGDYCNFTASGFIQTDGVLSGSPVSYAMQVNSAAFGQGTITAQGISGNLVGPGSGTTPITGVIGSFMFDHNSGEATVNGGFGANLGP